MYFLIGYDRNVLNIKTLVGYKPKDKVTLRQLKKSLAYNLSIHQGQKIKVSTWQPEVINSPVIEQRLLTYFIEEEVEGDILDPITQAVIEDSINNRDTEKLILDKGKVVESLNRIRLISSPLHDCICLMVNNIFFANIESNFGGSTERALGIIWMNLPKNVDNQSIEEFIVHESTHQMTFYDNLCNPYYQKGIYNRPESYTISAIRKVQRPLPFVIDSLLVACEILDYRKIAGYSKKATLFHPSNPDLIKNACMTLDNIYKRQIHKRFLQKKGAEILDLIRLKIMIHNNELPASNKCSTKSLVL